MDGSGRIAVPHAVELLAFADAAVAADAAALRRAREAVVAAMGEAAMVDAAAVIAGFDGITRIADATGIPLEPPKAEQTADFRRALGIDRFETAKW
jgi:hypothetical protein